MRNFCLIFISTADAQVYEEEKFMREKRKETKKKLVSALFAAQLLRPRNRK